MERGEIFGLLGPNGAGKTTTVGILTTRVIPTAGRAFVGGVDVVSASRAGQADHRGGVAAEHPGPGAERAGQPVSSRPAVRRCRAARRGGAPTSCSTGLRLAKWARSSVYELSGGMAQRLLVARAIFHRPAVLFLDEPTAGLDPQGRLALWEVLGDLNRAGQTILLTTHNMEEADRLCDRVAIIDHGRILALGTPRR
ncbi:ABC transporter ATP-binding protein [Yinghuangia aomiensis]